MNSILIAKSVSFLFLLSSCANQALVPPMPETALTSIAQDATGQLASLYPPAQTHLVLESGGRNLFDDKFKSLLRQSGYALYEMTDKSQGQSQGKHFAYFLDTLNDVSHYGYYLLTLNIGNEQLSRLYDANDLSKPNYWSYRK
jgi:Conjugal transfer protein TrbH